jgi:uncharacterized protein (TIGR02646 family)
MKKHLKHPAPVAYQTWFDENKERLQAKPIDETQLFEAITPKLKRALNNELLKEQGSICAYCGKRIGKNPDTLSIDHFEPKFCNRNLTLAYANLVGTCKMSEQKSIVLKIEDVKVTPKTYQNIAQEHEIAIENFTGMGKIKIDDDLEAHNIAQVKYRAIPLHCDDTKERQLESIGWQSKPIPESVEAYILNPNKHDCELYFEYEQDGSIKPNLKLPSSEVRKAENCIKVFNLDNHYLRKARIDAYKRANELLESAIELGMELEDVFEDINRMNDGKLDPYCFVTAYAFKQFIE